MRLTLIALLLTFGSQAESADFFILPGTSTLLMMGKAEESDVQIFQKYIYKEGVNSRILNGTSGSIEAGNAIADIVSKHAMSITVPEDTDCESVCSLIFSAGDFRTMGARSRLGFHLPFLITSDFYNHCKKIKKTEDEQLHVWKGALDEGCLMLTYQLGFLTDKLKLNDIKKMLKIVARDGTSEAVVDLIVNKVLSN